MAISEPIGRGRDASGPIEYKDAPIRFTFVLDGREEPVKIVEPTIDVPFPDSGRLLVNEADKRLCDVVFRFDPEAKQPYHLTFKVLNEVHYGADLVLTYGARVARESDMTTVYRKTIVDRGSVHAQVEMTRGKARLVIRSRKETR